MAGLLLSADLNLTLMPFTESRRATLLKQYVASILEALETATHAAIPQPDL